VARVSPTTILEDATVPRSRLAETFAEIERLKEKYGVRVATFGHAGDGNLHPAALTDERNAAEIANVHAFFSELYEKVLAVGGTVSGEHGIGIAKKGYLLRQFGEGGMAVMRRIKDAFDPAGRLNPGEDLQRHPLSFDRPDSGGAACLSNPRRAISILRTPRVTNLFYSACAAASASRSAPRTP
jgi:hypothetical protein